MACLDWFAPAGHTPDAVDAVCASLLFTLFKLVQTLLIVVLLRLCVFTATTAALSCLEPIVAVWKAFRAK